MNCPCESGLKSSECCLRPDGAWYKTPESFTPQQPKTGFSHPHCYLRHTEDCSTSLSDEHYVSEAALRSVDNILRVTGVPWLKPGEYKDIPASRFYSRILCTRHNIAFSTIDNQGCRFIKWIKMFCNSSSSPPQLFTLFNGLDIERWCLKVFLCLLFSSNLQVAPGNIIRKVKNIPRMVDLLFGNVPDEWGRGFWIRTDTELIVDTKRSLSVSPISRPGTNRLFGLTINMFGFDFLYSTAPINVETSVFRPSQIIFRLPKGDLKIEISWPSFLVHSGAIEWNWAGRQKNQEHFA